MREPGSESAGDLYGNGYTSGDKIIIVITIVIITVIIMILGC